MKIVEFRRENWRDASRTPSKIADQLDSNELPVCSIGVMAMRGPGGRVEVFAFGPVADARLSLALYRRAEQKLIDVLLDGGESVPQVSAALLITGCAMLPESGRHTLKAGQTHA
ncbi:TPA: hypothetical protein L3916_004290 [Pseudomonas aeruginosa]|nr:hypothetical protein [Pseudomonas aeruginosa]HBN9691709.1 hypothetical protein [Pseudomonas aeruginosa]